MNYIRCGFSGNPPLLSPVDSKNGPHRLTEYIITTRSKVGSEILPTLLKTTPAIERQPWTPPPFACLLMGLPHSQPCRLGNGEAGGPLFKHQVECFDLGRSRTIGLKPRLDQAGVLLDDAQFPGLEPDRAFRTA